jgi:hypothetical protein
MGSGWSGLGRGKAEAGKWKRFIAGASAGPVSANWCNGTLRCTIGWKDAASRLFERFVHHDSIEENLRVLWQYIEQNGRALEFYTDRPECSRSRSGSIGTASTSHHR